MQVWAVCLGQKEKAGATAAIACKTTIAAASLPPCLAQQDGFGLPDGPRQDNIIIRPGVSGQDRPTRQKEQAIAEQVSVRSTFVRGFCPGIVSLL